MVSDFASGTSIEPIESTVVITGMVSIFIDSLSVPIFISLLVLLPLQDSGLFFPFLQKKNETIKINQIILLAATIC